MNLAPIAIFVYNRPMHTQLMLEALKKNNLINESEIIVYSDGPKENDFDENKNKINEVRQLVKNINWCKKLSVVESETNKGLAKSIIEGVTEVVNKFEQIIVLEDDLITSPYFLTYMNECLNLYKEVTNVYSVNGYMFPIETDRQETVLLPYTSTWGWGTWKNKWAIFDYTMAEKELIIENRFLSNRFNLADYPYTAMLNAGNNSWGIRWHYSVFCHNGLGVFPTKTLISNIGFDGSGENCRTNKHEPVALSNNIIITVQHKIDIKFYSQYLLHFKSKENNNILKKIFLKFTK